MLRLCCSQRVIVGFAGPDADHLIDIGDEDLAVTDLAGPGIAGDGFNHRLRHLIADRHFNLDLGKKIHGVFGTAINLGMSLLPPVTLNLTDRHSLYAKRRQRLTHFIKLEWLDDRRHEFHARPSPSAGSFAIPESRTVPPGRPMARNPQFLVDSNAIATRIAAQLKSANAISARERHIRASAVA